MGRQALFFWLFVRERERERERERAREEVFICAKMSAFCVLAYSICASDGKVPSEVKEKERKKD